MIQAEIEQRLQEATLAHLPDADVPAFWCVRAQIHSTAITKAMLMGLAKQRKMNPQLAEKVVETLDVTDW